MIMKSKLLFFAVILIFTMAASVLTTHFSPEPGIGNLFFVPFLVVTFTLFRMVKTINYKTVLQVTLAGIVWIFISDFFKMDIIFPKLLWSCVGAVLTLVVVWIYNKLAGKVS